MDLALYDHIEVVRGATGLTQTNSEPGGTINAVRKKPTDDTQLRADAIVDRFGKVRATGDASGTLNKDWGVRGRVVAVGERDDSFKRDVDGSNGLLSTASSTNNSAKTPNSPSAASTKTSTTPPTRTACRSPKTTATCACRAKPTLAPTGTKANTANRAPSSNSNTTSTTTGASAANSTTNAPVPNKATPRLPAAAAPVAVRKKTAPCRWMASSATTTAANNSPSRPTSTAASMPSATATTSSSPTATTAKPPTCAAFR